MRCTAEPWPRYVLEEQLADPALAVSVLTLHLYSQKWIHHRLHQITFQDDTTVRHRFTVDLTVPELAPALQVLQAQEVRLLPLDLLRKQSLVNFEIRDQGGRRLPYFTSNQLGVLTGVMITKYAEGLLNEPLSDTVARCLKDLVTLDGTALISAQQDWERMVAVDWSAKRLSEMIEFASILKRLINNHILLVPIDAGPGTRLNLRYCLDVPISFALDEPPKEGFPEQMGWRCTRVDFPLEAAAETEIYHFEVEDPPGLDLAMAAICEFPPRAKDGAIPTPIVHAWQRGGLPRLNLRVSRVQQGSEVVARVDFRSSRQGWLPAFVTCAWVVALLLAIGAWRMDYMLHLGKSTEGTDPIGVAAAVLVFLAGVIATLLARSDEHGLTRKILSRLRRLALFTATLPGVAAAALLFVPTGPPLRWAWFGLAFAGFLAAVLYTFSYFLPKYPKEPPVFTNP
jgi:hypothetical protein